jgi:hypothetical protein
VKKMVSVSLQFAKKWEKRSVQAYNLLKSEKITQCKITIWKKVKKMLSVS